jgi:hypothetical protein
VNVASKAPERAWRVHQRGVDAVLREEGEEAAAREGNAPGGGGRRWAPWADSSAGCECTARTAPSPRRTPRTGRCLRSSPSTAGTPGAAPRGSAETPCTAPAPPSCAGTRADCRVVWGGRERVHARRPARQHTQLNCWGVGARPLLQSAAPCSVCALTPRSICVLPARSTFCQCNRATEEWWVRQSSSRNHSWDLGPSTC